MENSVFAKHVKLTPVSLMIMADVSFKDWMQIGDTLLSMHRAVHYWIGDWLNYGTTKWHKEDRYLQAVPETGYDIETLQNDAWVCGKVQSHDRRDLLRFGHHQTIAPLPREDQVKWLEEAVKEQYTIRDLREAIRRHGIKHDKNIKLPNAKYDLIYADPPWEYGNSMPDYVKEQANYYPLMSIDNICAMPVKEIANDNAVLFLWATSPILEEAFKVIEAWGFEYKTSFVWDKVKHNMGHYSSVRHEFLLLAIRGSYPLHNLKLYDSVHTEERTEHSKKPEYYYTMIEDIYSGAKKIELFARNDRKGWDSHGNQLSRKK